MHRFLLLLGIKRSAWLLVEPALRRGYTPVLVAPGAHAHDPERLPAPFRAGRRACRHVIEVPDWDDHEALADALRPLQAEGRIEAVYTNQDEPLLAAAMLRQRHGLPTTPAAVLANILHKRRAREALIRRGLTRLEVVPGAVADTWTSWPAGKSFFFKSCFGGGKRGVAGPLDSLDGLAAARSSWQNSAAYCNPVHHRYLHRAGNEYYLEEAFLGADLMSVEGLWLGGRFHVLGIWSRFLDWPLNPIIEMGGAFPWPHVHQARIVALVEAAHRALGVSPDAGPTHTEVLVRGDEVEICEVNHRFGGVELQQTVSLALDLDLPDVLLSWAAGSTDLSIDTTPKRYVAQQSFFAPPGAGAVLESVEFPAEPDVVYTLQYQPTGSRLGDLTQSSSLVGSYLVAAPTFAGAIDRARALRHAVKVNGLPAGY